MRRGCGGSAPRSARVLWGEGGSPEVVSEGLYKPCVRSSRNQSPSKQLCGPLGTNSHNAPRKTGGVCDGWNHTRPTPGDPLLFLGWYPAPTTIGAPGNPTAVPAPAGTGPAPGPLPPRHASSACQSGTPKTRTAASLLGVLRSTAKAMPRMLGIGCSHLTHNPSSPSHPRYDH